MNDNKLHKKKNKKNKNENNKKNKNDKNENNKNENNKNENNKKQHNDKKNKNENNNNNQKKKKNSLFYILTNELTTNVGYKYNDVCNMIIKIVELNKWILLTRDRKHGKKLGFKVTTSSGYKISDSILNKSGKIEPRLIGNLKNFLFHLIIDEKFINPFK